MEIETNRDSVCITYIAKSMNNVLLRVSLCLPNGGMFSFCCLQVYGLDWKLFRKGCLCDGLHARSPVFVYVISWCFGFNHV